ncbi:TerB family tellurite resistance protein [Thalassovita taeanensis]|uniref:Uncharacterized conserved protein, tellurite resistance protein B (TerB) family n=1 Tax=Thalassovita taeanensis TaxID=657014 RepID=A0A1H9L5N2_9RHOB|nr:TerB family tellurite resistance protein [Thalassovita taeanensis]SER06323.1 Uncharacterized conserved protein, tellurite resistance protein B (TerB) family [Thalassovita taeanensis]
MFSHLFRNLTGHRSEPDLPEPDAKLALGALLVRVAKSDHRYHVKEIQRIDRLLAQMHGLNPVAAAKMRALCEKLEARAPHTDVFAALIREGVDFEDRFGALEAMWQVILADGEQTSEELVAVTRIQHALGLSEADNMAARTHAAEQI